MRPWRVRIRTTLSDKIRLAGNHTRKVEGEVDPGVKVLLLRRILPE